MSLGPSADALAGDSAEKSYGADMFSMEVLDRQKRQVLEQLYDQRSSPVDRERG